MSRAKIMVTKYNEMVTQLKVHGVDFILATGIRSHKLPNMMQEYKF